jgi:hypothetical protein
MAYNINFCEGNPRGCASLVLAQSKNKTKKTLLCLQTLPNFNLAKKNNYASIDPKKKYNRHNKNYS